MSIIVERQEGVVIIHLARKEALNALSSSMMNDLVEAMKPMDTDPNVGCFIIAGSEKAFAVGADIKEMSKKTYLEMFHEDFFSAWEKFTSFRTPKIAAVSGYAFGGGCELAMMCDIIYASETAKFAQPEIKIGVIPGMGGSQRLTKLIGKAKAMDMILTGRIMDAYEAERAGLVARVLPQSELLPKTFESAKSISEFSKTAVVAARETVDRALEVGLREGILFERRLFHSLFATQDQKEGMGAFIDKREPVFTGT